MEMKNEKKEINIGKKLKRRPKKKRKKKQKSKMKKKENNNTNKIIKKSNISPQ